MATKKDPGRKNRPKADAEDREQATLRDAQRKQEKDREEARRRKEEGPTRHGPQPPKRGLKEGEPLHDSPAGTDDREGILREGSFRHVKKDEKSREEE